MNKYSDKSDFEINKAVVRAIGAKEISDGLFVDEYRSYDIYGSKCKHFFDPCNNPADAWPIIFENRISVIIPGFKYKDGYSTPFAASGFDDISRNSYVTENEQFNENPLRAAMEVFLMMKEAENEK